MTKTPPPSPTRRPETTAAALTPSGATLTSTLAARLRLAILRGQVGPGTKLRLGELQDLYGVSLSPLREALSRLAAEGFVVGEDQRGYRVAGVSSENLREIVLMRSQLEPLALEAAVAHGGDEWEEKLVGLVHRLDKIERSHAEAPSEALENDWDEAQRAFHAAMLSAAHMPLLQHFCMTLRDLSARYSRLFLANEVERRTFLSESRALLGAIVARDSEAATRLVRTHITRVGDALLKGLADHAEAPPAVKARSRGNGPAAPRGKPAKRTH